MKRTSTVLALAGSLAACSALGATDEESAAVVTEAVNVGVAAALAASGDADKDTVPWKEGGTAGGVVAALALLDRYRKKLIGMQPPKA